MSTPAVNNTSEQPASVPAVQNENSGSSTPAANMDNSYYEIGSESLCSQGAQQLASSYNQTSVKISQSSAIPASSYFVASFHYVKSQNSCYIELHDQLPLPPNYTTVVDIYTLYIEGGPSGWQVKTGIGGTAATVATCSTYPNGQVACNYYDPLEKDQIEGNMSYTNWLDQYDSKNAPPMSQQDFQSLVQSDMTAN